MLGDIREGLTSAGFAAAVLLGACLIAGGCTSAEGGAERTSGSNPGVGSTAEDQPLPGADQPFPSLGSVPERPTTATPGQRRDQTEGLVSDRARSRYSDEAIGFQGEPAAALQPPENMVTDAGAPRSLLSQSQAIVAPFSGPSEVPSASEAMEARREAVAPDVPTAPRSTPVVEPPPSPETVPVPSGPPAPALPREPKQPQRPSEASGRLATEAFAPPFSGTTTAPSSPVAPPPVSVAETTPLAPAAGMTTTATTVIAEPLTPPAERTISSEVRDATTVAAPPFSAPAAEPTAAFSPPVAAPPSLTAAVEPFAPPPPATGVPPPRRADPPGLEQTFMARLQETFAATAAPLLPPPTGLGADPERPLVTVVVSSEGVERYGDRPVFLPELSPEPTRFDRFPSPGGIESTLAEPAVAARSMAEPLAGERMAALPAGGGSVKVATILFDDGSARLGRGEMDILRKVAVLHRQLGGSVRVVGHASSRTRNMDADRHRTVNHQISVERASAVARELTRLGVPSERVFATAMADELPVYHEVMPSGEAGNRRAEIFIDY